MTDLTPEIRLKDIKGRKGHLCQGGHWETLPAGRSAVPVCGCGERLDTLPDFMDAGRPTTAAAPVAVDAGWVAPQPAAEGDDPQGQEPPPPFRHAGGEPCWGCQSCFAEIVDFDDEAPFRHANDESCGGCEGCESCFTGVVDSDEDPSPDPMGEADQLEVVGRGLMDRWGVPAMEPELSLLDPTQPFGPAEIEVRILDANNRLERAAKHEANLVAVADQLGVEYALAYARALSDSDAGAADQRKADATVATEDLYRRWKECVAVTKAMQSVTHTLRSTLSGYQSIGRSVSAAYNATTGRGR